MSEYTPTTSEVREAYEHGRGYLPPFYDPAYAETVREHQAQFDRWLAAHDRWLGKPQITDAQVEAAVGAYITSAGVHPGTGHMRAALEAAAEVDR